MALHRVSPAGIVLANSFVSALVDHHRCWCCSTLSVAPVPRTKNRVFKELRFWQPDCIDYVARNWYETEYGLVAVSERWYHPTMLRMEWMAYVHRKNRCS